jgi:hypothetical protein
MYINLNPTSPSMTGLIKIHKQDTDGWVGGYMIGWKGAQVSECMSE